MQTACTHLLCYEEKMPKAYRNWNYLTLEILKHGLFQVPSCYENPLVSGNQLVPLFKKFCENTFVIYSKTYSNIVYKISFQIFRVKLQEEKH